MNVRLRNQTNITRRQLKGGHAEFRIPIPCTTLVSLYILVCFQGSTRSKKYYKGHNRKGIRRTPGIAVCLFGAWATSTSSLMSFPRIKMCWMSTRLTRIFLHGTPHPSSRTHSPFAEQESDINILDKCGHPLQPPLHPTSLCVSIIAPGDTPHPPPHLCSAHNTPCVGDSLEPTCSWERVMSVPHPGSEPRTLSALTNPRLNLADSPFEFHKATFARYYAE